MKTIDVMQLLRRARSAQDTIADAPQARVDQLVAAAGWYAYKEQNAQRLAAMAVKETSMGELSETYERYRKRVLGTLQGLYGVRTVGVVESLAESGIKKLAKPVGVIAAITPTTAPCAAATQIALMALKTRNAVIFSPHPSAQKPAQATIALLREALREIHAPENLLQCVANSRRDETTRLMESADLILAAGGQSTVRRAYSSGTPAYGAGVGNAVVVVDETANLPDACRKMFSGKAFDNGTSCSAESSVVISEQVWDAVINQLRSRGAHLCDAQETRMLRELMWPGGSTLARSVVGQHAEKIARFAGFPVSAGTRVLMAVPDGMPGEDPLGAEKLSPVLSLWKFQDFPIAIGIVRSLLRQSGRGHSCGIHTRLPNRVDELARAVEVSRVMVNQSTGAGNSGDFANGMPFTTVLCCGTWGGSISNENITWRHLLNYTWVSEPTAERTPDVNALFAPYRCMPALDVNDKSTKMLL